MKKRFGSRIISAVLACALILTSVPVDGWITEVLAAEVDTKAVLEVQFDQEYAAVGQELSVTVTGAEDAVYTWYVGGTKIDNTSSSYIPTESDLENMIEVEVSVGEETVSTSLYFSKLPVVYIDTNGQAITSKEDYIDATMTIQGNAEYNSETTKLYDGVIEIRGRGNTTWGMPKKPYKIKLDKKTDIFGMGKNKHWVLLANYSDESLMRNTLSYNFSGSLGMEQMSTVWTSVVMNGEYVGNYQFCEQVRVDETRVDVFDWESFAEDSAAIIAEAEGMSDDLAGDLETYMLEENMGWITSGEVVFNNATYDIKDYPDIEIPSINGGYILELDEYYDEVSKFRTNSNQPIMFKNPEFVYTNSDMMAYVKAYVQAFEDAVQSADYTTTYDGKTTHYSELYDFEALVDYWLISEIFFNEELNKKSTYMYKEIDELMKMGPIWDMDYSSGGEGQTYHTNQWATLYYNANAQSNQWYKDLVKDPYFLMKAQERYWEIRYEETADMITSIDTHYEYLKESGAADYEYWLQKSGRTTSFDQEVNTLKNWFNNHITWMDGQMETEDTLGSVFYSKSGSLQLALTDADGNALNAELAFRAPADAVVENGKDLTLSVSGTNSGRTATVFVNGKIFGSVVVGDTIDIPASALTEVVGTKNVIEVKAPDANGYITGSNYITVKQKAASADTDVQKTNLETLLYEAMEKEEMDYTAASWAEFEDAYNDAFSVMLDTGADQNTVDNAEAALRTAMEALVVSKNPASDTDDYDVSKITYSAGSAQDGEGIELAFDKNEVTFWHTQYNPRPDWYGTAAALDNFWVLFELEEATVLDAVRYLPRNGNGDILSYRVEGSLDGKDWIDLVEGDWAQTGQEWKAAEFEPTELKYVRLWATATTSSSGENRHVSARELRLRTGELPVVDPDPPVDSVAAVEEAIDAIGKVTAGSAEAIEDARAAYNALSEEDKARVDNYQVLVAAETEYKEVLQKVEELQQIVAAEKEANLSKVDYTESTWSDYTEALKAAEALIADKEATQEDIDAAKEALENAKNALEKVDVKPILPYEDVVERDWFYDAVEYTYYEGLMTGMDATHFGPYGQLSRAQFALILYRMEGEIPVETTKTFGDIAGDEWYGPAVLWAAENGIVTGYQNGNFGPADMITREQMAVMMYRYARYLKQDVATEGDYSSFEDAANVSEFAEEAIVWAVGEGIITGKENGTKIDPQGNTARSEAAIIIQRFLER